MGTHRFLHTQFRMIMSFYSEIPTISLLWKALKILNKLIPKPDIVLNLFLPFFFCLPVYLYEMCSGK